MIGCRAVGTDQAALGHEIAGRIRIKQAYTRWFLGLQRIGEQIGADDAATARIDFNAQQVGGDDDGIVRLDDAIACRSLCWCRGRGAIGRQRNFSRI